MASSTYVSRINQIDAAELDNEIHKVLRSQLHEIVKYQPLGKIDRWQPELDALLKFLVWNFSVRASAGGSTFGQQLLNLRYSNLTGAKSVLYLAFTVLPDYAEARAAADRRCSAVGLRRLLDGTIYLLRAYELFNLLSFLHRGTQARLIERLLGISSTALAVHTPRNIGYSYMTRELLWHGLIEMFTLGLPMINYFYLKETYRRICRRGKIGRVTTASFPTMSQLTKCGCCDDTPILPVHAGCDHLFCYYCLKARFTAVTRFQCPRCDSELRHEAMKTYQPADDDSS